MASFIKNYYEEGKKEKTKKKITNGNTLPAEERGKKSQNTKR